MKTRIIALLLALLPAYSHGTAERIITGDERTELYLPLLDGKRVALFSNQTGLVGEEHRHVLDLLVEKGVKMTAVFSPEHGFRGSADAGAVVADEVDERTGIPILSLYGQNRKKHLGEEAMGLFDVLLVDIQDVGLRYYTYYVTMCHLMDACAKYGREVIILDRPNPNGHYVDGPILDMALRSGVGYLPIPVVHGMTLGELARMAVGEKWLNEGNECKLTVIPCLNYTHQTHCTLPVPPSPNLPNMQSIYLYPSLCPFEGTVVSMGRGTDKPFQQYGHPGMQACHSYSFTPQSMPGATRPTLLGEKCYGKDLSTLPYDSIWHRQMSLAYVIDAYQCLKSEGKAERFFTSFFDKLLGQTYVREMIEGGYSEAEIRARWKDDVEEFKQKRQKYMIYEAQEQLQQGANAAELQKTFTTIKEVPITSVKNQHRSGTCWDFATLGYFESEILRKTGKTYDLCEMFVVNKDYMDCATHYVRMHGYSQISEGGSCDDVLEVIRQHGICPEDAMPAPGSLTGDSLANFKVFFPELEKMVSSIVKKDAKSPMEHWQDSVQTIIEKYVGRCPESFVYEGKTYTPKSFAETLGLDLDDYVSLTSYTHHPFWQWFVIEAPYKWRLKPSYNIPIELLMDILDKALDAGYTVAWGGDVTGDFTRTGLAMLPDGVTPTQELRQEQWNDWRFTYDHVMLIYGKAVDEQGKPYYMVKNSWGQSGQYKGIWYMSRDYMTLNTTYLFLNRKALSKNFRKKL